MNVISFPQWLRLMRQSKGYSQARLASTLKVLPQTISNWETGKSKVSLTPEQTCLLCEAIECDLIQLAKASKGEIAIVD